MEVAPLEVDREEARKRVEEFTAKRRKKLTEMDHALFRGYKALAEGLTLIDVNQAIKQGGHFEDNYCPKLSIARSDLERVYFDHRFTYDRDNPPEHGGQFAAWRWSSTDNDPLWAKVREMAKTQQEAAIDTAAKVGLNMRFDSLIDSPIDERKQKHRWFKAIYQTLVPPIPFHLRPNGDAEKYFILWEVEKWEEYRAARAPGDPLLLERIAHPIYVVVAQWDLSELEKRILESFRR